MAREVGADGFELDLSFIIGEYERLLADQDDEEAIARLKDLLVACKEMNGKSLQYILNLVDTGAFNNIISAYCMRALNELDKSDDECAEILKKLEELYDYDAEDVVIPQLTVETEEDEDEEI